MGYSEKDRKTCVIIIILDMIIIIVIVRDSNHFATCIVCLCRLTLFIISFWVVAHVVEIYSSLL